MRAIPKILIGIKREKAWLKHFAARERLDLVISDNRYGLNTPCIPCILITHQLLIKTPFGPWADRLIQSLNYRVIRHFFRCWIPDTATGGLAGDLSHPERMPPIPHRYIGWLSRFDPARDIGPDLASTDPGSAGSPAASAARDPLLLVLLSGPEPARTLLENEILYQALALANANPRCSLALIRGLPGKSDCPQNLPPWVTVHNHLPAKALAPLLYSASLVLARPGYSTAMDLERLGKQALFIPTPGQTEQEYLGPYLATKGWATCIDQRDFSLVQAIGITIKSSGNRHRQPEEPGLLAAEIKNVLDQSCPPDLG